jgi:hypothetical protein
MAELGRIGGQKMAGDLWFKAGQGCRLRAIASGSVHILESAIQKWGEDFRL